MVLSCKTYQGGHCTMNFDQIFHPLIWDIDWGEILQIPITQQSWKNEQNVLTFCCCLSLQDHKTPIHMCSFISVANLDIKHHLTGEISGFDEESLHDTSWISIFSINYFVIISISLTLFYLFHNFENCNLSVKILNMP